MPDRLLLASMTITTYSAFQVAERVLELRPTCYHVNDSVMVISSTGSTQRQHCVMLSAIPTDTTACEDPEHYTRRAYFVQENVEYSSVYPLYQVEQHSHVRPPECEQRRCDSSCAPVVTFEQIMFQ